MINHIFGIQPDLVYLSRQKRSIDYTSEEHLINLSKLHHILLIFLFLLQQCIQRFF